MLNIAGLPAKLNDQVLILIDREQIANNKGESQIEYSIERGLTSNIDQPIQGETLVYEMITFCLIIRYQE